MEIKHLDLLIQIYQGKQKLASNDTIYLPAQELAQKGWITIVGTHFWDRNLAITELGKKKVENLVDLLDAKPVSFAQRIWAHFRREDKS